MIPTVEGILSVALAQRGYREDPINRTRFSAELDEVFGRVTLASGTRAWRNFIANGRGMEWCAIFCAWAHWKASGALPPLPDGGFFTPADLNAWRRLGRVVTTPEPGDFVYYLRNGTPYHVGLVIEVRGNRYSSIEGNTSPTTVVNPDGGGVFQFGPYKGTPGDAPDRSIVGPVFARPEYRTPDTEDDDMAATLYLLPDKSLLIRGDATPARRVNSFEVARLTDKYGPVVHLDPANPDHQTIIQWLTAEIAGYDRYCGF